MGDVRHTCWAQCPPNCSNTDGNHLLGAKDPAYLYASCRPSTRTRGSALKGYDNEETKPRTKRSDDAGGHGPAQREGPALRHGVAARRGPGAGQADRHDGGGAGKHLPPPGAGRRADGAGGLDQLLPRRAAAALAGLPGQGAALGRGVGPVRRRPRQRPHRRAQHRHGVRAEGREAGGLRPLAAVPRVPRPVVCVPQRDQGRDAVPQPDLGLLQPARALRSGQGPDAPARPDPQARPGIGLEPGAGLPARDHAAGARIRRGDARALPRTDRADRGRNPGDAPRDDGAGRGSPERLRPDGLRRGRQTLRQAEEAGPLRRLESAARARAAAGSPAADAATCARCWPRRPTAR